MIDIRKLKELVRLMVANELTELDLRDAEEQVTLRRPSPLEAPQVVAAPQSASQQQVMSAAAQTPSAAATGGAAQQPASGNGHAGEVVEDSDLDRIESPMVGTFYSSPNPDSDPFVRIGDHVDADSVVCIVEAMKIFNEIKAECSGTIEKMLVENGDAVEFGQPLFLVRSD